MHNERNYGIDALRMASMFMVVLLHVLQFGTVLYHPELGGVKHFEARVMQAACMVAVNCYALISGFVGVNRKVKPASMMMQWLQVVCYCVGLVFALEMLVPERVNMSSWKAGLTPVINREYWYYSMYVLLCLMMPMLNELLHTGSRETLRSGLRAVLAAVVLLTAAGDRDVFEFEGGFSLSWLALLYMIGGYLKLYGEDDVVYCALRRHSAWIYMGCVLLSAVLKCAGGMPLGLVLSDEYDLYGYMSPLIVLESIALFSWFSVWKPGKKKCRWIARLAPAAFGVYLIHMQANVCEVFMLNRYMFLVNLPAAVMPFAVAGVALVIYGACTVIDLMRAKAFELLRVRRICQSLVDAVAGMTDRLIK